MNAKFLTLFIPVLLLASCNKEPGASVKTPESETVKITSGDAERLVVYDDAMITKAQIGEGMPECPTNISYDFDMSNYQPGSVQNDKSYHLAAGNTYSGKLNLASNTVYYVDGEMSISSLQGGSGVIYVMPNGKLTLDDVVFTLNNVAIYNYGTLVVPQVLTINYGSALYTNKDLDINMMQVGGHLYVGGAYKSNSLAITSSSPSAKASLDFGSCATLNHPSEVNASVRLMNCTVYVRETLSVAKLHLDENVRIQMVPGAILFATTINVGNPSASIQSTSREDYAVIKVGTLTLNHSNLRPTFNGAFDIHYETLDNKSAEYGGQLDWASNIKLNGDTYIAPDGCNPGFGTPPVDTKKEYILNHVAAFASPREGISATSIQQNPNQNNITYVSWHTFGDLYSGYVDILDIKGGKVMATVEDPASDFNHIIFDNNKLWVTGGTKKGAFIGSLSADASGNVTNEELVRTPILGASGNCVVANASSVLTASGSNGGFQTIDKLSNSIQQEVEAAFAKHIDIQGDNLIALTGTTDAKISIFNAQNPDFTTPISEFQIGDITPVNGKNVCRIDGETIYVAMGNNGVKAFNKSGAETAHFTVKGAGAANGLDFDDKFVYVANGSNGLIVLDKITFEPVASYVCPFSANYVTKGKDGLIYVAYGLNGVQVFSLIEKE